MKKSIIIILSVIFIILGCDINMSDNNKPTDNTNNSGNSGVSVKIDENKNKSRYKLVEVERIKLTRTEEEIPETGQTDKVFIHKCDKIVVDNYDLKRCVFHVEKQEKYTAECVILCDELY